MGSFDNLKDDSDEELIHKHKTTANEYGRQDISLEMNMRLKRAIEDFSMKSSEQSEKMIRLTKWIMGLTMVMGLLAFIQVIILIK